MTSIPTPVQLPSPSAVTERALQSVEVAQSTTSPVTGGTVSSLASGPAPSTARSYANATGVAARKPQIVSGSNSQAPGATVGGSIPHHGKSDSILNGKPAIPPAVPAVGTSAGGNNTAGPNGASVADHSRKPSVTITAAGSSGTISNGGPVTAQSGNRGSIVFGSIEGSPAATYSQPQVSQAKAPLPAATPNQQYSVPQPSPSPIPQPRPSGGDAPPLHGSGNSLSFGSFGNEATDNPRAMRPTSMPPQSLGPQSAHLRRESSQSAHGEMGGPGMSPGRGGYPQTGRGRGYQQPYQQPQVYQSGQNYRQIPNQPRGGQNVGTPYQQRQQMNAYPHSPHQAARSPALTNSIPGTPMMHQPPMSGNPQMGAQYGYPQAGYQVNSQFPLSAPHIHYYNRERHEEYLSQTFSLPGQALRTADLLDPQKPYFSTLLTAYNPQGYGGMPQFEQGYQNYQAAPYGMYPGMQQYVNAGPPPSSPGPRYQQQIPGGQPQYYGHQPSQSMSRTPSGVSDPRPPSAVGQRHASGTPVANHVHRPSQGANSPAPTQGSTFQKPTRKSAAIIIKDPNTNQVVTNFEKSASPAPISKSPAIVSSTPTPPPKSDDSLHARTESRNAKSDAEKKNSMKEQVAKAKAEAEQAEKAKVEAAEKKAAQEKEDAQKAAKLAEEKEQREKEEAEAAKKAAEEKARQEEEDRIAKAKADEDARKAAEAKAQAEELEKEKAKAEEEAAKEAAAKAAAEALARAEESDLAKEADLAKEKGSDSGEKELPGTPSGLAASVAKLSLASGTSTPASDDSMGPPTKAASASKRGPPAALDLRVNTKPVEPAQPTPGMLALRSARFIDRIKDISYPPAIASPNPALNAATTTKGKFKYDKDFLLQFQRVFKEKPQVDWDSRLKETVGDPSDSARPQSARTPQLGPRGSSNRAGGTVSYSGGMGSFVNSFVPTRTLPPGTTSEQRMQMSSGTRERPMANPLAQFGNQRPFPSVGPSTMMRTNSSTALGLQGGVPQSPRSNNRSQRGNNSNRGKDNKQSAKQEEQAAKTMPLTANIEVAPLLPSTTGWKPTRAKQAESATGAAGPAPGAVGSTHLSPEMVQRKVKSNLNKMTPEKFEKISDQILEIAAQSKDETDGRTLRQVIQLTFEKATDEAHWAPMYAKFCKRMLESMNPEIKDEGILDKNGHIVTGGNLFRKYLLNRCQEEFERGWKMNLPAKPEGESEAAAMLSEEYYIAAAAKRRGLGLVKFIGELYKLSMLTERIMHECVKKLVDYEGIPDEAEVESLTSLLRTIGRNLDMTERGPMLMNAYFQKITEMMNTEGLASRLRFMLMDIVDLRKKGWDSKEEEKGPKTIQEIREAAQQAELEKQQERARQDSNRRGGGSRMPMGRGDARQFSGGHQYGMQQPPDYHKNTVASEDLKNLSKKSAARQNSQGGTAFGPTSFFSSRQNSNSRRGFGSAGVAKGGEESGASSRTGTPPAQKEKEPASANAFSALAGLDASGEPEHVTSPPSAPSSPPTTKTTSSEARAKSPAKSDKGEKPAES